MPEQTGEGPTAAIAVAASAGGVEALIALVRSLPADFPAAVLVVLHIPDVGPSVLPGILGRAGRLAVMHATDGAPLRSGQVLVAPPGQHMRVLEGVTELDRGPKQNGHRPSADALFESLAAAFDSRAAGLVLSGTMEDGAAGLLRIGQAGGLTIVQDPAEATFPGMPMAAIQEAAPDVICRVDEMVDHLLAWLPTVGDRPNGAQGGHRVTRAATNGQPAGDQADPYDGGAAAEVSEFTCPDCGGTLWLHTTSGADRYRCRVGHSFSAQSLLSGKQEAVESALWAAIVALEERADLSRRLVRRLETSGRPAQLKRYRDQIKQAAVQIESLRGLINELVQQGP